MQDQGHKLQDQDQYQGRKLSNVKFVKATWKHLIRKCATRYEKYNRLYTVSGKMKPVVF